MQLTPIKTWAFMRFLVIDVELANQNPHSICQIALVAYKDGKEISKYSSLIDPEEDFFWMNLSIHGIDADDVEGKPTFVDLATHFYDCLNGRICVSHGEVGRKAIEQAFKKRKLEPPNCQWLNSAKLVRRSWDQFKNKGCRGMNAETGMIEV